MRHCINEHSQNDVCFPKYVLSKGVIFSLSIVGHELACVREAGEIIEFSEDTRNFRGGRGLGSLQVGNVHTAGYAVDRRTCTAMENYRGRR